MISRISIKKVASYGSFQQDLSSLTKINFIYGSNGTGKTTISRLIDDPKRSGFEKCQLSWENDTALATMVYNRDFIKDNFDQREELKGIFTLGKGNIAIVAKIESTRVALAQIEDHIATLTRTLNGDGHTHGRRGELQQLNHDFTDACWRLKQQFDGIFKEAFKGLRNNRLKFRDRVLLESNGNRSTSLPFAEIESKATTVFAPTPTSEQSLLVPDIARLLSHELDPILSKKVIGKTDVDISALITRLKNSDWVKQGRQYYDPTERTCPFCQQRTSEALERSLNDYFDVTFQADSENLEKLHREYSSDSDTLIRELEGICKDPSPRLDIDAFESRCESLKSKISINIKRIEQKLRQPSVPIVLVSLDDIFTPIRVLLNGANAQIRNHNKIVANFDAEKSQLIGQVWRYLLDHEIKDPLNAYKQSMKQLEIGINSLELKIRNDKSKKEKIEEDIRGLEKDTTSIQPTIDAINNLLRLFHFQGFRLAKSDHDPFYKIQRSDGSDAKDTLSEGESSFIAFLYFYHLLKGSTSASGVTTNRVVVFDDPVSSLDSQVLFVVSNLIKDLCRGIGNEENTIRQVFVLTHNVYFHNEVSYNHKRKPDGQALPIESFWVVNRPGSHSIITSRCKNPISTTYKLLWSEVQRSGTTNVALPNTFRRILEYYFEILGNVNRDKICKEFDGQEQSICRSLFSWTNAGSHGVFEEVDFSPDESMIQSYKNVFKEIFVKTKQLPHYKMMMGEDRQDW